MQAEMKLRTSFVLATVSSEKHAQQGSSWSLMYIKVPGLRSAGRQSIISSLVRLRLPPAPSAD